MLLQALRFFPRREGHEQGEKDEQVILQDPSGQSVVPKEHALGPNSGGQS